MDELRRGSCKEFMFRDAISETGCMGLYRYLHRKEDRGDVE
ncbi:MAG: hypothetical protein WAV32_09815 [Halobacteriota archaeon]